MIVNIILTSASFTLFFMMLINFILIKELRLKFIFEPFILLILTVSSVIGMNISLFIHGYLHWEDAIIAFTYFSVFLSTILFLSRLARSSNISLSIKFLGRDSELNASFGKRLWGDKKLFYVLYYVSLLYLLYAIQINYEAINQGYSHGDKINLYNENYAKKLFMYFDIYASNFIIFFTISFIFLSRFKIPKLVIIIFLLLVLAKFGSGLSRASLIYLFMMFAPFAILFAKKNLNYFFVILFPFLLGFGVLVSSFESDSFLDAYLPLVQRIFLNSDFALWFRYYDYVEFDRFHGYDFFYYFYVLFSKFFDFNISAGLGPYIVSLYSSDNFGNGPIPTFFYEFYILFRGNVFALVIHAVFYGAVFFLLRYYSMFFLSRMRSYLNIVMFYYLYFHVPMIFGDFFSFFTASIIFFIFVILLYLFLKIRITKGT